jgi:hypothetical protein
MSRSTRSQIRGRAANPMRIPGFTAEAGLHRTATAWRTGGAMAADGLRSRIVPQFCIGHFGYSGGYYITCCNCFSELGCVCTTRRLYYSV